MYQARVDKISGLKVYAGGKWLTCIGNKPVRVGDLIWTDGRCVYGNYIESSTPFIPSKIQSDDEECVPLILRKFVKAPTALSRYVPAALIKRGNKWTLEELKPLPLDTSFYYGFVCCGRHFKIVQLHPANLPSRIESPMLTEQVFNAAIDKQGNVFTILGAIALVGFMADHGAYNYEYGKAHSMCVYKNGSLLHNIYEQAFHFFDSATPEFVGREITDDDLIYALDNRGNYANRYWRYYRLYGDLAWVTSKGIIREFTATSDGREIHFSTDSLTLPLTSGCCFKLEDYEVYEEPGLDFEYCTKVGIYNQNHDLIVSVEYPNEYPPDTHRAIRCALSYHLIDCCQLSTHDFLLLFRDGVSRVWNNHALIYNTKTKTFSGLDHSVIDSTTPYNYLWNLGYNIVNYSISKTSFNAWKKAQRRLPHDIFTLSLHQLPSQ